MKTFTRYYKSKEKAEKAAEQIRDKFLDVTIQNDGSWWLVFGRDPK